MINLSFTVHFPCTRDLGPCKYTVQDSPMESKEEQALWQYNSSRAHDGLPPVDELPAGTYFTNNY
jgi:hypothetical protein